MAQQSEVKFNTKAALWLVDFLLSQPVDRAPFDWPDPAILLLETLEAEGWKPTDEQRARVLWMQTHLDAGIDSYVLTASIWENLQEKPYLIDPEFYLYDWDFAREDAYDFVANLIGHHYSMSLAPSLPVTYRNIGEHFGGNVLQLIRSNGHPASAKATMEMLLITASQLQKWQQLNNSGELKLDVDVKAKKHKLFPGMGPKKSRLFLLRLAKTGLVEMPDIHHLGIPADVHAVVLSFCAGVMKFEWPVNRDKAVKLLHDFWSDLCRKRRLNNVELYWRLWLWGRRYCRPVNCHVCPLHNQCERKVYGRLSTSGYYADDPKERYLDPYRIIEVPATLAFDPEFLTLYAPETKAPGIRVTEKTVEFVKRQLPGMQLALSEDEPEPNPAGYTEEAAGFDPFEF